MQTMSIPVDQNAESLTLDLDAEFGGMEARQALEKRLLRKLDTRMSVLIAIYILNYVCISFPRLEYPLISRQCTDRQE
jgi:hypothetical protein